MPSRRCPDALVALSLFLIGIVPTLAGSFLSSTPFTIPAGSTGTNYASSLGNAGDVNGDGYVDLIAGDYWYENGQTKEGRAVLYYGSPSGFSAVPDWNIESDQAEAWYGYAVAGAGDVNGDGFADVVVGSFRYTGNLFQQGRAFLYLGSSAGLSTTPAWTSSGRFSGAEHGLSVASAGDVNGDGFGDVIVGAASDGAYLYLGSPQGLAATASWTYTLGVGSFLQVVAGAGDVNGDGYGDVLLGEDGYSNDQPNEGQALIFLGSPTGPAATPDWRVEGDQEDLLLGTDVSAAGDVNGDGFDDVLVGAYRYDGGLTDIGKSWLYLGSATGPATSAAWTAVGDADRAWFGWQAAPVGDVDGDSYDDVSIVARNYPGIGGFGRAYVYRGGPAGLSATPAWDTGTIGASSVGIGGDLNRDGLGDVLIGLQNVAVHQYYACANGPIANAGPDRRVKVPQSVTFDASATQNGHPPLSYEWDLDGDGIPDASGPIATFTYGSPGTYTFTLTVSDALHCTSSDSGIATTKGKLQL